MRKILKPIVKTPKEMSPKIHQNVTQLENSKRIHIAKGCIVTSYDDKEKVVDMFNV